MPSSALSRVLVVNLKSLPTWHLDLADGFGAIGVEAHTFVTTPQTLAERADKSLRGRKWFRSAPVLARLVEACRSQRPDLVLFLGLFVLPVRAVEALARGLDYTPQLAGWVCDCFRAPQFEDWTPAAHVFYFDTFLETVLPRYYGEAGRTTYLPLAASPSRYRPLAGGARDPALVFVGNVSANRRQVIERIAPRVPLVVHGPNAVPGARNRRAKLDAEAINAIYNRHPVVLNINQSPNTEHGLNLRAFEVPAAGAVLLTQACADLPRHFVPGEEVLAWNDDDELVEHYQRLRAAPARAQAIAAAGRARVRAEHTFEQRARRIVAAFA